MKESIEFESHPDNCGTQVLVFSDPDLNIIARNQMRMSREIKKYKITIELIEEPQEKE